MQEKKILAVHREKIQVIRGLAIIAVVIIQCTPVFSMHIEVFFKFL